MRVKAVGISRIAAACAVAAGIAAAALAGVPLPAQANSGVEWYSLEGLGAFLTEDCPLEVEEEVLTFNISSLPSCGNMDGYSSTVTAQYTFYNPTDSTVTAKLLFPFGNLPYYVDIDTYEDAQTLAVTADGQDCGYSMRFSYNPYSYNDFDFEMTSAYLTDGLRAHPILSQNAQVTVYSVEAGIYASYTNEATFVALGSGSYYSSIYGRKASITFTEDSTLYFVGNAPSDLIFTDENDEEVSIESAAMTFAEVIEPLIPACLTLEGNGKNDWFNFVTDMICDTYYGGIFSLGYLEAATQGDMMRWVEYEITVPAGGTLENSVTVPVYPTISGGNYIFNYLLSPAESWADFGSLTINVNTSYYVIASSPVNLTETDGVYTASTSGLPEGELYIEIGTSAASGGADGDALYQWVGIALIVFTIVMAAGAFVAMFIILFKKDKTPPADVTPDHK